MSSSDVSELQEWYRNKTVLVTGATGSLGKMLVEKLLRTCPDVRRVYLLVREKDGQDVQTRLRTFLNHQIFHVIDTMRSEVALEKIEVVHGDLERAGLGLLSEDYQLLTREVEVVLHAAATVRFNETLRRAISINVHGTREVCLLAQNMKKLEAFVYISTAFSNCDQEIIRESVESSLSFSPEQLINLTEQLEDQQLEKMTADVLGSKPNTYVYSKSSAEEVVKSFTKSLPAAIIRPSIIGASMREPVPGWLDSPHGVTGYFLAALSGLLHIVFADPQAKANIVPLDYTTNAVLALAYSISTGQKTFSEQSKGMPVVNFVSTTTNGVSWSEVRNHTVRCIKANPSEKIMGYPFIIITSHPWLASLYSGLLHTLPAIILDFFCLFYTWFGLPFQLRLRKTYQRIDRLLKTVEYFIIRDFQFEEGNAQLLWESLEERDKQLFPFNMADVSWTKYICSYVNGSKQFLMQQSPTPKPQAIRRLKKFHAIHITCTTVLTVVFAIILWKFISVFY